MPENKGNSRLVFFLVLFLLPLAVYMKLGDPSSTLKIFLVRVAGVVLAAWILAEGKVVLPSGRLLHLLLLFLLATFVPAVYSAHLPTSFIGIYPFFSYSVLTVLCLTVFFIFACSLNKREIGVLVKTVFVSALLVSLYGILQYFKFDFLLWKGNFYPRIWSTLGNPNFLASYLAMILPIGLYAYIKRGKLFWIGGLLVVFWALFLTSSRAGMLSGIAGTAFFLITARWTGQNKKRIKTAGLLFMAVFFIFGFTFHSSIKTICSRYMSSFNIKETNISSRVKQWDTALEMFKRRPLLGWGLNGYYIYFRKYMNPEFLEYTSDLSIPGYPHNYILKILNDGGLIFSVPVLLWWLAVFVFLYRNRARMDYLVAGIAGSFVAVSVQTMFGFNVVALSAVLWVLLGAAVSASEETMIIDLRKFTLRYIIILPLAGIIVFSFNRLCADYLFHKGDYSMAAQKAPEISRYAMSYGRKLFMEKKYNEAKEVFLVEIKQAPFNALAYNGAGSVYLKQGDLERASGYFKQALERDPYLADSHLKLAGIYRDKEDFESAAEHYETLLKINPNLATPRYNLGVIYFKKGNYEMAASQWKKVLALEPDHEMAENGLKALADMPR